MASAMVSPLLNTRVIMMKIALLALIAVTVSAADKQPIEKKQPVAKSSRQESLITPSDPFWKQYEPNESIRMCREPFNNPPSPSLPMAKCSNWEDFKLKLEQKDIEEKAKEEQKKQEREKRQELFRKTDTLGLMPRPIINIGNTCFLNAIMQCFGALRAQLFTVKIDDSTPTMEAMAIFAADLLKHESTVPMIPFDLISGFAASMKKHFNREQQDAAEVVMSLYEMMIGDQKAFRALIEWKEVRSTTRSDSSFPTVSGFEAHLVHYIEILPPAYSLGEWEREGTRIYQDLSKAINSCDVERTRKLYHDLEQHDFRKIIDLGSLISAYYSEEDVGGGKKTGLKHVGPLPAVYTIALKRFNKNPTTGKCEKNKDPVRIPEYLEVASVPLMDGEGDFHPRQEAAYRIRAVILHTGELASGHYTAMVRVGKFWHLCNDAKNVELGFINVIENGNYHVIDENWNLVEYTPYVLFYEILNEGAQ